MPITTPNEPTLIVFGGTFDPPHDGHIGCVEQALLRFPKAKVYVLPAAQPPATGEHLKTVTTSFDHRMAMAQLAFSHLAQRVEVLPLEQDLPRPSFTSNTLRHLAAALPNERLGFLLGQDQWAALPKWHEPRQILQRAHLVVVSRAGSTSLTEATEQTAAALGLELTWNPDDASASLGTDSQRTYFITAAVSAAASSSARQALAQHTIGGAAAAWLPPAVTSYIKHHQLYSLPKDQP